MRAVLIGPLAASVLSISSPASAQSAGAGFVFGQERQIVYYSPWNDCIGNPATPLCALESLFSCMVRADHAMCAQVGVAANAGCPPGHVTGVRYILERVTQAENMAHVSFRAEVCRNDAPCRLPTAAYEEDLERAENSWRFRASPQIYTRMCPR